jgi:phosphohistidine phosphatase
MKLFLTRHGIASEQIGGAIKNDAQRPLTSAGREETELVAAGLKRLGVKPSLILSSPFVRARQTAEILAEVLNVALKIEFSQALLPGGLVSDLFKELADFKKVDEVFLVGHQPDMTRLAQSLLWAGQELDIPFKKAGVCRIDIHDLTPTSPGILKWHLTPRIAALMSGKSEANA